MAKDKPSLNDLPGDDLDPTTQPDPEPEPDPLVIDDRGLEGVEDAKAPLPADVGQLGTTRTEPEDVVDPDADRKQGVGAGFGAMREVKQAKRQHADARARLAQLQAEIDSDNQTLLRRRQIEHDYESIVKDQQRAIDQANAAIADLTSQIDDTNGEIAQLQGELQSMKDRHAKDLAPYKDLSDAAKKRADGDAAALKNAKREAQSAERRLKDLTKQRDRNVTQANKDAEAASQQLVRLQDRLNSLNEDPTGNAAEIAKVTAEIAAQTDQRERAQARASSLPKTVQADIDAAQGALSKANGALSKARKASDASKKEAGSKGDEYKDLRSRYKQEEDALDDQIVEVQKKVRALNAQIGTEQQNLSTAQAILEEAEAIHSTPEETDNLAMRVADNSAAAEVQRQQVDALAQNERDVRNRTKQLRLRALAVIILLVMLAMVIIGFVYWVIGQGG